MKTLSYLVLFSLLALPVNAAKPSPWSFVQKSSASVPLTHTDSHTGMEFLWVEGGCFNMGSNSSFKDEKPVHEVCLEGFLLGKYEVTQLEWEKVMGGNPSKFKGERNPVEKVSWKTVQKFIKKLSQDSGIAYRLPTEAEWEYAARGGNRSNNYSFSGSNNVFDVAWFKLNADGKTHPVGEKAPNELGFFDMSGNVYEWVSDWYGRSYYAQSPQKYPKGPAKGSTKVRRGGSWYGERGHMTTSVRAYMDPIYKIDSLGFRLAVDPGEL